MPPTARRPANVAHFAVNADDLERAQRFYQRTFGWSFAAYGPPGFLMAQTGTDSEPGIRGSLQQRRELVPGVRMTGFECTIAVADIDAVATAVVANGGEIVLPRTLLPGVGHLLFFRDTEGNLAGAMQYDARAADDE